MNLVKKLRYIWSKIIFNSSGLEVNTFGENMLNWKWRVTRYTQWLSVFVALLSTRTKLSRLITLPMPARHHVCEGDRCCWVTDNDIPRQQLNHEMQVQHSAKNSWRHGWVRADRADPLMNQWSKVYWALQYNSAVIKSTSWQHAYTSATITEGWLIRV